MTTRDRIGAWEVALDLLELGREAEAVALLDAELPDRLNMGCAACGASANNRCRERAERECKYCAGTGKRTSVRIGPGEGPAKSIVTCPDCGGRGQREIEIERLLPHQSRILKIEKRWGL